MAKDRHMPASYMRDLFDDAPDLSLSGLGEQPIKAEVQPVAKPILKGKRAVDVSKP